MAKAARGATERQPVVKQLLAILRRRKWVIFGCVTGALLAGIIITMLMTPQYRATATIEIQRESHNFTMVQGADTENVSPVDLEFYQTQYGLLRARSLAERVVTHLGLQDNRKFFQMFGVSEADTWFGEDGIGPRASTRAKRIEKASDILLRSISIAPQRLSRLVDIEFTSPDPELSRKIVSAWVDQFIGATLERRYEATSYARKFLDQRLEQLRGRIDESERKLVDYASREGIINLPATSPSTPGGASSGERSLAADDLATLNHELSQATADRVQAQSRVGASGGAVTEALQNTAISNLRGKRAELAAEYARLMVQFQPDYPPARSTQEQIRQLDQAIAREESRVGLSLKQSYTAAVSRESALKTRVDQLASGVLDLRRRSIQYNIYQRDVDTNRQLYDALLQRYKEIGVAGGVGVNNIALVDAADLPDRPSSPRFLLNVLLSLFLGGALGIAAGILLEQLDQGISDPGEIETVLGIPLIGTVPSAQDDEQPIELLQDRKSALAEAYMSLRTSLAFSTDHGIPRTLTVTSTRPAEGKSTTAYALAFSIARANKSVILVDGDMRSPSVHGMADIPNKAGLSNYLAGDDNLDSLIVESSLGGLSFMLAGPQPPSSPDLLSSERFAKLMRELLEKFDHVVVDCPPVMGLADAPLVASQVEGVVFAIEAHRTPKTLVRTAIDRLRDANAPLVGCVLVKFDVKRAHYGYGYDYGYGYGYGDTASKTV